MSNKEYYKVLGIDQKATPAQIKQAYKKMALKTHPDKNPDNKEVAKEQFKKVSEAYSVLSDKRQKELYDKYGKEGLQQGGGQQQERGYNPQYQGGRPFQANYGQFNNQNYNFSDPFENMGGFNFTFQRAEQLFKETFGEEELHQAGFFNFGNDIFDNDPFFGGKKKQKALNQRNNDNYDQNNRQMMPKGFGMFDDDDDFFGGGFGGFGGFGNLHKKMNKAFGGSDPFQMMRQDMGGMDSDFMMGFSSSNMGGNGVQSKVYQQSTIIKNGKQVSVAKSHVVHGDGTQQSNVREFVRDGNRVIKDESYNPHNRLEYQQPQSNTRALRNVQPQSQPRRQPQNAIGYQR